MADSDAHGVLDWGRSRGTGEGSAAPKELAFSVSQEIQPPDLMALGRFLASQYERIRVLAFCPDAAVGDVELVISHLEGEDGAGWLDRLSPKHHQG